MHTLVLFCLLRIFNIHKRNQHNPYNLQLCYYLLHHYNLCSQYYANYILLVQLYRRKDLLK